MAFFDSIGEFGLNEVIARRLTTPGGSAAPSVAPELFASLTLENDRPEWGHLKGELRFAVLCVKAAVAAEYGQFQLYLPTTARSLAVITNVTSLTANVFSIARLAGISGGLGGWAASTTRNRDTRAAVAIGGACFLESVGNAAIASNNGRFTQFNASGQQYSEPIIIGPGGAIGFFCETVNQELRFSVSWRERLAQPGELV